MRHETTGILGPVIRHRLVIAWAILLGWHLVSLAGWLLQGSYPSISALIDPMVNRDGKYRYPEGAVEAFEAVAWFVALIAYLAIVVPEVRAKGIRVNPWLVLLPALCLAAFGEEISWGQHLFHWRAPDAMAQVNLQQETNAHNLDLGALLGLDPASSTYRLLRHFMRVINPGAEGLCAFVWVILPTLCAWNVGTRLWIIRQIPVPRAGTRFMFVVAALAYIVVDRFIIDCGELMELGIALLAALAALDLAFATERVTEKKTADAGVAAAGCPDCGGVTTAVNETKKPERQVVRAVEGDC